MHTFFDETNDVLLIRLSSKHIERQVTQDRYTQVAFSADGEVVELRIAHARECGAMPVERVPTQIIPRAALSAAREFAHARH
jgi:hypothetical protein